MAEPAATPSTVAAELEVVVVPLVTVATLSLLEVQVMLSAFEIFDNEAVNVVVFPTVTVVVPVIDADGLDEELPFSGYVDLAVAKTLDEH